MSKDLLKVIAASIRSNNNTSGPTTAVISSFGGIGCAQILVLYAEVQAEFPQFVTWNWSQTSGPTVTWLEETSGVGTDALLDGVSWSYPIGVREPVEFRLLLNKSSQYELTLDIRVNVTPQELVSDYLLGALVTEHYTVSGITYTLFAPSVYVYSLSSNDLYTQLAGVPTGSVSQPSGDIIAWTSPTIVQPGAVIVYYRLWSNYSTIKILEYQGLSLFFNIPDALSAKWSDCYIEACYWVYDNYVEYRGNYFNAQDYFITSTYSYIASKDTVTHVLGGPLTKVSYTLTPALTYLDGKTVSDTLDTKVGVVGGPICSLSYSTQLALTYLEQIPASQTYDSGTYLKNTQCNIMYNINYVPIGIGGLG